MITLDRSSRKPVQEQLTAQLRYLIASGAYRVGERLPSTRDLGKQIGVSFHTVRKAYQQLSAEGLLQSVEGAGFTVSERRQESKSARMERGAAVVREALQQLVGLGLDDSDIEYLVQDQLEVLESARQRSTLLFAAPSLELAELCADQVARAVQQEVEPVAFSDLSGRLEADYIFVRVSDIRAVLNAGTRADVIGVTTYYSPEALNRIGRMMPHETLGIVTFQEGTLSTLMADIRMLTGFEGQVMAASTEDTARHLDRFFEQLDLLAFTPAARRRLGHRASESTSLALSPIVSRESIEHIRQTVPA